jgi:hypothetical protein
MRLDELLVISYLFLESENRESDTLTIFEIKTRSFSV